MTLLSFFLFYFIHLIISLNQTLGVCVAFPLHSRLQNEDALLSVSL